MRKVNSPDGTQKVEMVGSYVSLYIEHGCCDGLTAKYVRDKFPQFKKYQYACFNGALGGMRRRFNGAVRNRAYDGKFIWLLLFSLYNINFLTIICSVPHLPLLTDLQPHDALETDPDDSSFVPGDISCVTDDFSYDESTVFSKQTGYHSEPVVQVRRKASSGSVHGGSNRSTSNHYGKTDLGLPYIVDNWRNKLPRQALGLQVWMPSGFTEDDNPNCRIASDQWGIILDIALPESATDPKKAFSYILYTKRNGVKVPKSLQDQTLIGKILPYHPKVIARTNSIMKLRGHDHTKKTIWLRQRISINFKAEFKFGDKKADDLFHGCKLKRHDDGTVWMNVELIVE